MWSGVLFPTIQFGIFFPIVFVGSWLLRPHPRRWKLFILVASYVFYGWWDWHYCLLLAGVPLAKQLFVIGLAASSSHATKQAWCIGVTADVAVGYFKYYGFRRLRDQRVRQGRHHRLAAVAAGHPAHRHLVLHVPGDELRDRRLPGQPETGRVARLRRLPLVLPPSRGRPDRAGHRVPAATAQARRSPAHRSGPRVPSHRGRHVQEGGGVELPRQRDRRQVFAAPGNRSEILFAIYGCAFQIYADFSGYTTSPSGAPRSVPPNFDSPYTAPRRTSGAAGT